MIILSIRTDKPEAEIGLFTNKQRIAYTIWQAHRELSTTIHAKIEAMLSSHGKHLTDIQGIVCYQGPGSFTGLRIGLTVANALVYGLDIPIVAAKGDDWLDISLTQLLAGENQHRVVPFYGASAHVSQSK